jgi:CHAT domain-containing protein/tetratricopeptide (TPR) repeat protein
MSLSLRDSLLTNLLKCGVSQSVNCNFVSRRFSGGLRLLLALSLLAVFRGNAQTPPATAKSGAAPSGPAVDWRLPTEVQAELDKLESALKTAQAAGDASAETATLDQLGELYLRTSDYTKALDFFKVALSAARGLKDSAQEAAVLNGVGACYVGQGQSQKALESFQEALDLATAAADKMGQATALNGLGWVNSNLGLNQKALEFQNQAMELARRVGDHNLEANILRHTGITYFNLEDKKKAFDLYNQALGLAQRTGDIDLQALILRSIGYISASLKENRHPLDYYQQAMPLFRQAGDRHGAAGTLYDMSEVFEKKGDKAKAMDFDRQALAIYHQVGARSDEAWTLYALGKTYLAQGENRQALEFYQQALLIHRELGNRSREADLLIEIAGVYRNLDEERNELDAYNQVLPIRHELGDRKGEAWTLNRIGETYAELGENQQALEFDDRALDLYRQLSDLKGQAYAMTSMGIVYTNLGDKQRALDEDTRTLALYRQLKDRDGEASMLTALGYDFFDLGDMRKALELNTQALTIYHDTGNRGAEVRVLRNLGYDYNALGDGQKKLELDSRALELEREFGDRAGEAFVLTDIGNDYRDTGQQQKAVELYTAALAIQRLIGSQADEANTLSIMALNYATIGEGQKALEYHSRSLELWRTIGNRVGEAVELSNIGDVYLDLNETQKALDYFNQALALQRDAGNRNGEAQALAAIGNGYERLKESRRALDAFNQSLAFFRQTGDRRAESNTLNDIGMVYRDLEQYQPALDSYNQSLAIQRELSPGNINPRTLTNVADAYWNIGDKQKSIEVYHQALREASAAHESTIEAYIFYALMIRSRQEQPALAIFYGKQAVNLLQHVRGNMQGLDKELQTSFLSYYERFYHSLGDLLIAQGRLPEAQQVLGLLKQQEYTDFVRGDPTDTMSPLALTPAEQQAEEDYQRSTSQLVSLGEQWAKLKENTARNDVEEKRFEDLTVQLDVANKSLNGYYDRLYVLLGKDSTANKQVADLKGDVSALEDQIAETPHTVALYTMVTSDYYRVIVITPAATVAREYAIADKDLNMKVAKFQQVLRDPRADPKPLAQELYTILLAPVKADLDQAQAETLVWSLDGVLRYVPIAALYDGNQYVVEKYNTVTITPASIAHLGEKPDVSNLTAAAMGISHAYEKGLSSLPAVVGELDQIVKNTKVQGAKGALPGTILLDEQFTEKAMEKQLDEHHGVVHIASHFVFQPGDDSQSYLLLAGKEAAGEGFHLTVADFRDNKNLTLRHTDLLTLSACETGMSGNASNGREIDGLGTTAQLKGARAVISSLWSVNDASTGQLMGDFYRRWTEGAGKVTKVEALRLAQLDLLRGKVTTVGGADRRGLKSEEEESAARGFMRPYYWAPFVLMGNWR